MQNRFFILFFDSNSLGEKQSAGTSNATARFKTYAAGDRPQTTSQSKLPTFLINNRLAL